MTNEQEQSLLSLVPMADALKSLKTAEVKLERLNSEKQIKIDAAIESVNAEFAESIAIEKENLRKANEQLKKLF